MTQIPEPQTPEQESLVDKPRAYDLTVPAEVGRLMRETYGYLHTCYRQHGTDWEGRKFAMEALKKFRTDAPRLVELVEKMQSALQKIAAMGHRDNCEAMLLEGDPMATCSCGCKEASAVLRLSREA